MERHIFEQRTFMAPVALFLRSILRKRLYLPLFNRRSVNGLLLRLVLCLEELFLGTVSIATDGEKICRNTHIDQMMLSVMILVAVYSGR